ncbi:MAG: hypothetical protein HY848_19255 [Betaproteobacteria bacterium]|nr:hypothetical protein [Betaproteobacteria bacterium]
MHKVQVLKRYMEERDLGDQPSSLSAKSDRLLGRIPVWPSFASCTLSAAAGTWPDAPGICAPVRRRGEARLAYNFKLLR